MRLQHERLVRCIQCPTAYHIGNFCLPAGSEILTGCQIICPRHYVPPRRGNYHVNAAWCSLCTKGGSLICCDLCPNSFHLDCLGIPPPEDGYICEDCDTGRFPLYGEVVWVKLGVYRWWPALILFPSQIPENIKNLPHRLGEFAIRFFGSHDHYWVNRGRVFFYQEGDSGLTYTRKSAVDDTFQRALAEAIEAHKTMKGEKAIRETEARQGMKPPSYVRIKSNKPVGNVRVVEDNPASMTPCDCDPNSENPCGPDSDCINRILMVECSPGVCAAEDRCRNQSFEKRQYPPLVPFKTESRGWGLKTLTDISKGDFVIEYVGELIDEAEYRQRLDRKHQKKDENYYFLTIDKDRMLDAGPKGNNARFMNHSCQPNCETQKWTVNGDTRVGLFALCDISEGSELTFNYNLECVGRDKKPCNCGAPNCSGFIGVKASKQIEEEKKLRVDQQSVKQNNKKKKKKLKMKKLEALNNICYQCGEGEDGKLLFCDNKTCPKGYHMNCVELKQWPKDKWLCPWHRCNICKKRTIQRCNLCPNSFCMQHADGNIKVSAQGLICQKHDKVVPPAAKPKENQVNTPSKPDVSTKNLSFKSKDTKEKRPSVSERLKAKKAKFSKETVVSKDICVTDIKIEEDIANISTDTKKRVKELELSISEHTLPTAKKINKLSDEIKIVTIPQPRKRGRPLKNADRILEDVKEIKATPKKTAAKKEAKSKTALEMELEEVALSFEQKVTDKKNKCKPSVNGLEPNRVSKRKRQPSVRIKEYFESNPTNNLESLKVKDTSTPNIIKTEEIVRGYKEDERSPKKRKTILQRIDHKIMSETGYRNIEEIPNLNLICHSSSSVEVRRSEDLKKGIDHNWLRPTDTKEHANENGESIEGSALENDKMNETAMEIGSVEGAECALQPADANLELNENNAEGTPFDESPHNKNETNPLENITCINDRSDVTDTTFTSLNNKEIPLQQDGINGIENNFDSKSLKTIDTSSALLLPVGS